MSWQPPAGRARGRGRGEPPAQPPPRLGELGVSLKFNFSYLLCFLNYYFYLDLERCLTFTIFCTPWCNLYDSASCTHATIRYGKINTIN